MRKLNQEEFEDLSEEEKKDLLIELEEENELRVLNEMLNEDIKEALKTL